MGKKDKVKKTQEEIDAAVGQLMDANSHLMKLSMEESVGWGDIGDNYHKMGELAHYVAGLQAVLASAAAKQAQAIIKTQFGVDIDDISPEDFAIDTEEYEDDDDTTEE